MEPVNKKQRRSEALPYPPEAMAEIEELRAQLADRAQLQARVAELETERDELRVRISERDKRLVNLEASLNNVAHEGDRNASSDDESVESHGEGTDSDDESAESHGEETDSDDDSSIDRFLRMDDDVDDDMSWKRNDWSKTLKAKGRLSYDKLVVMLKSAALSEGRKTLLIDRYAVPFIVANLDFICGLLQDNVAISAVFIKVDRSFVNVSQDVYRQALGKLGEAFGTLPALKEFFLSTTTCPYDVAAIATVLPTLPKLRSLWLEYCSISESGLDAIVECLNGSLLSSLHLDHCRYPEKEGAADEVVAAVKRNFTLEDFWMPHKWNPYSTFVNPEQQSVLDSIPRLNKAGRRYLKDDPMSIGKGVEVLSKVHEDESIESITDLGLLNCLFLHLQENPLLCNVQVAPQSGRKRKVDQSMKQVAK